MKKILCLCALFVSCGLMGKVGYWVRDGFRVDRSSAIPYSWGKFTDTQPYRYLGRGRQFYAFESLDGRYVVKLPRTDIYRPSFWHRVFPNAAKRKDQEKRFGFLCESLRIAAEELSEQTGVVAVCSTQRLHLIDRMGRHHHVTGPCVWQKKHPLLMPQLTNALSRGDRKAVEQMLTAFSKAIQEKGARGILTKDASFLNNFGYDGTAVYELDVGTFCHAPGGMQYAREPICAWLKSLDEEACAFFEEQVR